MPCPRPSILLTVLISAVLNPQLATAALLRRSGLTTPHNGTDSPIPPGGSDPEVAQGRGEATSLASNLVRRDDTQVKLTNSEEPRPNHPASDDNHCTLHNKKFDGHTDELATLVKSHSAKARVLIMGLDRYVRSAMDRLARKSICFEKIIYTDPWAPEMAYLQCRQGDAAQYAFVYFWHTPEDDKTKSHWSYWGNGYDQPQNPNLHKLVQLSGAKQTCHYDKSRLAPQLPTTPFPPYPPYTPYPTVEPPSTKEPIFTVEPIFPTTSPFTTRSPTRPPTKEPIFTVKPIFPTTSPFTTRSPTKPPTKPPIYTIKPIYPTTSPFPTKPGYPTAGPVPTKSPLASPPEGQPRNIYGEALEPCRMGADDGGSWDVMGQCTAVDSKSNTHNLCINTLPWDFSAVLEEGYWSKERHDMRHCTTVAQWSRYLHRERKANNMDKIKTIYPSCRAVPESVLFQKNAATWKGTAIDPGDLSLGVSEFVKKCMHMAKSSEEKCGLFWRAVALTKTTELKSTDLIQEAKKWMGNKMACPQLQVMSLSSELGMDDVNETYHNA